MPIAYMHGADGRLERVNVERLTSRLEANRVTSDVDVWPPDMERVAFDLVTCRVEIRPFRYMWREYVEVGASREFTPAGKPRLISVMSRNTRGGRRMPKVARVRRDTGPQMERLRRAELRLIMRGRR